MSDYDILHREVMRLRSLVAETINAYEDLCIREGEWCGEPNCRQCGYDAKRIIEWRKRIESE